MPRRLILATCLTLLTLPAAAQQLDPATRARLQTAVEQAMRSTGTPAAQIAIVRNGTLAYSGAFGQARVSPVAPATPDQLFRIGSNSKQFTAAAVLLLAEQGKLHLDSPVSTWFPELGHAHQVTVRQLLNQVSGLSDDYTEDYLTPEMAAPADLYQLIARWCAKPLDFPPGTQWQYSNTNYGLAALIVQKVSGQPFFAFLRDHILTPAGITHAIDLDNTAQVPPIPAGYVHYAFGPARPAPLEGAGTLTGAAELAMPATELARWNTLALHHGLLKPESWAAMQTEYQLPDGHGSGYGMGLFLAVHGSHRTLEHSGEVNGFVSENILYPADGAALTVLTNNEASTGPIVRAVEAILFPAVGHPATRPNPQAEALLRRALTSLAAGTPDRSLFTPALNFYFTPQAIADYKASLAALGPLRSLTLEGTEDRGGMTGFDYSAQPTHGPTFSISTYVTKDGKLDQLLLEH